MTANSNYNKSIDYESVHSQQSSVRLQKVKLPLQLKQVIPDGISYTDLQVISFRWPYRIPFLMCQIE
jgi:hypothetical protein